MARKTHGDLALVSVPCSVHESHALKPLRGGSIDLRSRSMSCLHTHSYGGEEASRAWRGSLEGYTGCFSWRVAVRRRGQAARPLRAFPATPPGMAATSSAGALTRPCDGPDGSVSDIGTVNLVLSKFSSVASNTPGAVGIPPLAGSAHVGDIVQIQLPTTNRWSLSLAHGWPDAACPVWDAGCECWRVLLEFQGLRGG